MATDANAYDTWFRMKVKTALEDARAGTSQVQVMQAAQALIDAKRQGQSKP
ncbi:StaA [Roseovarius sp. MMSF_3281]|jgi:DNA-damage-inducible protein J|uniref:StaA n=1 Tax=Roseovarius sp. MMSF_3281 TaxID=3046694 RepID=UPI00273FF181|nr:StaA [Roseovarius sp. MMSF_3281]